MKTHGSIALMLAAWLLAALASPRIQSAPLADPPAQTPSSTPPGTGLVGHWQGSLKPAPMLELRLALELTKGPAGDLAGVMVSLDQGGVRIPLTHVSEHDGAVRIEAKSIGGEFEGTLNSDRSELAGQWRQAGQSVPLTWTRVSGPPKLSRPQEPKKPYPYTEEEARIESGTPTVTLAGTLTLPQGSGPHPAVVLITGSGAQDRDEAVMGHRPFLVLADSLTRRGIAVLRCDDRGVGKSTGDFARATASDFIQDTLAQVTWLARRPEINPRTVGLLGHSEGGIIAPRAAVQSTNVAFIVLLAGVGVPMEDLLIRQGQDIGRVMGADEATLARNTALQHAIFRVVREEKDAAAMETRIRQLINEQIASQTEAQRNAVGLTDAMIEGQIRMASSPWFRDLLTYDPHPTLRAVKCPVLAVNGEKDLQVSPRDNLAAIRKALADGGNYNVKTIEFPSLNHLFQTCKTGAISEYGQIEETCHPAVLKEVSTWILSTTARIAARN
ncbi:MAG TPA: alpha/beta fold hydrolase [Candidatus Paceibacterota bacterium]|nr:alpha/beta fold hydrolase [Candidatus Paceibacterota bacterium]